MRSEVMGVILVVLVVMGLGVGYLAGERQPPTIVQSHTIILTSIPTAAIEKTATITSTATLEKTATTTVNQQEPIPIANMETANTSVNGVFMAVDPSNDRIYTANLFQENLTVLDASSLSVIGTIALPNFFLGGIATDNRTDTIYVLDEGGVAEISGSTDQVVRVFVLNLTSSNSYPYAATSLVVDPFTHTLYGIHGANLIEVNDSNGLVIATVRLVNSSVPQLGMKSYQAQELAINLETNLVYVAGCDQVGFSCNSVLSVVDGAAGKLLNQVPLGSEYYPAVAVDQSTGMVYVSGGPSNYSPSGRLVSMNATGSIIYNSDPQTCGPFMSMTTLPPSNQVILDPQNYDYLLVYDGLSLALVNMYSTPSQPLQVAYNPGTNEVYVLLQQSIVESHHVLFQQSIVAFHNVSTVGHSNSALVESYCPAP